VTAASHIVFFLFTCLHLANPGLTFSQPVLCYFGDSITEGWIDAQLVPQLAYPARADSILHSNGTEIASFVRGYGGETTDDALQRLDTDVLALRPDIITLAFGSNDLYLWGSEAAPRVSLQRFEANYRMIVRKLRGSGVTVLLLGLPPIDVRRYYLYVDSALYAPYGGAERLHAQYDSVIAVVAESMHCEYISLLSTFTDSASQLGFDGVHPSPEGHLVIAQQLVPAIEKALQQEFPVVPTLQSAVFPNPFAPASATWCSIRFHVDEPQEVILRILDTSGRILRKIVYLAYSTGNHYVPWDGRTDAGTRASPGSYILYVIAGTITAQHRILLM
jgi:lysophospholipase L1-like esterase